MAVETFVIAALWGLVVTGGGIIMKGFSERVKMVEKDQVEIKENYLDRFEKVIKNQNDNKIDVINAINELKIQFVELKARSEK